MHGTAWHSMAHTLIKTTGQCLVMNGFSGCGGSHLRISHPLVPCVVAVHYYIYIYIYIYLHLLTCAISGNSYFSKPPCKEDARSGAAGSRVETRYCHQRGADKGSEKHERRRCKQSLCGRGTVSPQKYVP